MATDPSCLPGVVGWLAPLDSPVAAARGAAALVGFHFCHPVEDHCDDLGVLHLYTVMAAGQRPMTSLSLHAEGTEVTFALPIINVSYRVREFSGG